MDIFGYVGIGDSRAASFDMHRNGWANLAGDRLEFGNDGRFDGGESRTTLLDGRREDEAGEDGEWEEDVGKMHDLWRRSLST